MKTRFNRLVAAMLITLAVLAGTETAVLSGATDGPAFIAIG
jgi:hypothetical protein